ncbi:MAG: hypothetical protein KatS3mg123_0783 [Burkholderiales bacterium]|nr:MAG: hypothetical protein KatS3mg123_0783 [Burkholderiales bacterium]
MTETWALGALWLGLALAASLLSIWLRVATALSEIVVGTVAQLVIGAAARYRGFGCGCFVDQVSFRYRSHCAHFSRGCGAGS